MGKGALSLRLSAFATAMDTRHDDVDEVVDRGVIDIVHDQGIVLGELRVRAEYGLTDHAGVIAVVPLRRIGTTIRYLDRDGREVALVRDGIHHRNEVLVGIGDPWLLFRYHLELGRLALSVQPGIALPLGRTEEDPFALGMQGLEHQHFQFGTGTVGPILAIEGRVGLSPAWMLSGYALALASLYENDKGYRAGDRYAAGLLAHASPGRTAWSLRFGTELQAETAEAWNGVRYAEEGNQGRIDWLGTVGVNLALGRGLEASASIKVPLVTHVVGGQLDYPAVFDLALGGTFELVRSRGAHGQGDRAGADEHDHDAHGEGDCDHGDEHDHDAHGHAEREAPGPDAPAGAPDWTGIDMVHLTQDGAAVPLLAVADRVTVFDFWAPWCAPCKVLDHRLVELARRHPDQLAIRKINVVDWDSAAAARYLIPGGHNLPHVKVYGRDGAPRFERSGAPDELARAIEAVVQELAGAP